MNKTVQLPTCPQCGLPVPQNAPQGLCPKCVLKHAALSTEQGVPATATSQIPSLERVGSAFPQLEILELIGRGGMGFVYKARHPHLDRFVALKLLPDQLAKDPQFAERFNREGRVLAKLNHPNIVSVFDFGQTGGFYFLLMEYVDGVNLRQAMRAGRFSPAEALSIVPKVCEALQYAHEQGILHRDIKPENLLLDSKGRVKIADFGIAKLVGEDAPQVTLTNTGASMGTPHYMAPEQLEKPGTVDHRADIYSLGVVFYELLTGELPIGRFAPPSSKTPVGSHVDEVVFRTLEKDRERRFQSAAEMKQQVEQIDSTSTSPDAPSPKPESEPRRFSHWAIYGSISLFVSIPVPLSIVFAILSGIGGVAPAEIWLSIGSMALPGLGGTLLGWLGLNEIREGKGRVKGLPLALFATLFWPLALLIGLTGTVTVSYLRQATQIPPTFTDLLGRFMLLLLPAAAIAFSFWAVYTTARWAQQITEPPKRGKLKWIFAGLIVVGMAMMLLSTPSRVASPSKPDAIKAGDSGAGSASRDWEIKASSWLADKKVASSEDYIRFTITALELRSEENQLWLVLGYHADPHGPCEEVTSTSASGYVPITKKTAWQQTPQDSPAVEHTSIQWLVSSDVDPQEMMVFRTEAAKVLVGKTFVLAAGENMPLFRFPAGKSSKLEVGLGVQRQAQAETTKLNWAPRKVSGRLPKPSEILKEAATLTEQGRYEDALQRHLWYHQHAVELEPSQVGVRLSFAVQQWVALGKRYSVAREALETIRDNAADEVFKSKNCISPFKEAFFINKFMNQDQESVSLFRKLAVSRPTESRTCYPLMEELLVEKGEYELCSQFIPDPTARFEVTRAKWESLQDPSKSSQNLPERIRKEVERVLLQETKSLIEILLGSGQEAEASRIEKELQRWPQMAEVAQSARDRVSRMKDVKLRKP